MAVTPPTIRFLSLHANSTPTNRNCIEILADGEDIDKHDQILRGEDRFLLHFDPNGKLQGGPTKSFLQLPERNPDGIKSRVTFRLLWQLLNQLTPEALSCGKGISGRAQLSKLKTAFLKQMEKNMGREEANKPWYQQILAEATQPAN